MLVGEKGRVQRPTVVCRLPGCEGLGFLEGGVCEPHKWKMIEWLIRRAMRGVGLSGRSSVVDGTSTTSIS